MPIKGMVTELLTGGGSFSARTCLTFLAKSVNDDRIKVSVSFCVFNKLVLMTIVNERIGL